MSKADLYDTFSSSNKHTVVCRISREDVRCRFSGPALPKDQKGKMPYYMARGVYSDNLAIRYQRIGFLPRSNTSILIVDDLRRKVFGPVIRGGSLHTRKERVLAESLPMLVTDIYWQIWCCGD